MGFYGLNIAIAQINPVVGNIHYNVELISRALETCVEADLTVFPELVLCGYPPEDLVLKKSFVGMCHEYAEQLAGKYYDRAFVLTSPWESDGKIYNAALLIYDGKIQHITYKHHLPNYGVFDEKRVFTPGPLPEPVEFRGHKLGIIICEDIWFKDCAAHLKAKGADILVSPNGSPFEKGKREARFFHARNRVKETGLPLIYVNQNGGQDDLVFDGGSFIMDGEGNVVYSAPSFSDHVGFVNINKEQPETTAEETIYSALKAGLADYIAKNGFPGVLIGMSGGIDSALSAAIAADALGLENVRCIMMPSPFTSRESLDDAEACASALGCPYETISIEPVMKAMEHTIPDLSGLAHENMQSRARGMILMSLSNQSGAMVLTTGNKSEMAVGYATLYGDMCGGFNVLKDVYKTEVYALARWRNTVSPVIPDNILTKAPTAELRPNQKDQDSLPPYPILDSILEGLIERDMGVSDLVAEGHDKHTVLQIQRLLDLAEYKRRQSAPGVKITSRAFGRDRRYPITNGHRHALAKHLQDD